jgi:hypothetical protein
MANLATVCWDHHPLLVPHGQLALVGNPNQPDGLHLVRHDELTRDQALEHGLPPPAPRRE